MRQASAFGRRAGGGDARPHSCGAVFLVTRDPRPPCGRHDRCNDPHRCASGARTRARHRKVGCDTAWPFLGPCAHWGVGFACCASLLGVRPRLSSAPLPCPPAHLGTHSGGKALLRGMSLRAVSSPVRRTFRRPRHAGPHAFPKKCRSPATASLELSARPCCVVPLRCTPKIHDLTYVFQHETTTLCNSGQRRYKTLFGRCGIIASIRSVQ